MSFTQAVGSVLRQYATFSGRARRSEYWWFYLFTFLVGIAASVVDVVLGVVMRNDLGIVGMLTSLAFLVPSLAVGARRLHDTGRTGWWLLLPIGPGVVAVAFLFAGLVAGFSGGAGADGLFLASVAFFLLTFAAGILLIVFLCLDSQPGPNRYGPSPKLPLPPGGYYPPQPGGQPGGYYPPQPGGQPGGYYPPQPGGQPGGYYPPQPGPQPGGYGQQTSQQGGYPPQG